MLMASGMSGDALRPGKLLLCWHADVRGGIDTLPMASCGWGGCCKLASFRNASFTKHLRDFRIRELFLKVKNDFLFDFGDFRHSW